MARPVHRSPSAQSENSPPVFPTPPPAAPVAPPTRSWSGRDWFFALAVIIVVFLAYQPVWRGGFIWDDDAHMTKPALRSWQGLGRIWFELGATQQYYPLLHSVFWFEHRLFGDAPTGYHLVNIALHALNAVMIGLILRRLRLPGAYLAAGIFALHPVMVESVAWITELKNTLSGLFYLGAALIYLRFDEDRRKRWYALALGLFVLGLLSKTVTATLPGALLVVFWWRRGRLSWKRDAWPLLPFLMLGGASGLLTAWVERKLIGAEGAAFAFTFIERGLIAGRVIAFYLGKLVWPAELIFNYPRWLVSQAVAWQYLYPAGVVLVLAWLWTLRHWSRGPLAGALFFIGTLFPVLGFFNVFPFVYSFVADHFQYLASLGVIVTAAAGVEWLRRWTGRLAAGGLCSGLLAVLGVLTWRQSQMYRDAESLYRTTIARNPQAWMAHNNLGNTLAQAGRVSEAIVQFQETLRLNPDSAGFHYNLANALAQMGRLEESIAQYEETLRLKSDYSVAHNNLGSVLARLGRIREAAAEFHESVRLDPSNASACSNLGNALLQMGGVPEAIVCYEQALQLDPANAETHFNLGNALVRSGRIAEAIRQYEIALELRPDFAPARNNLVRLRIMEQTARPRE